MHKLVLFGETVVNFPFLRLVAIQNLVSSLPYYLTQSKEKRQMYAFVKDIYAKLKATGSSGIRTRYGDCDSNNLYAIRSSTQQH